MPVRRSNVTYATIRTEGGLLPPDLLDRILRQDSSLGGFEAKHYGLPPGTRLMAQISEAWQAIQTHFATFRRTMEVTERDRASGVSETRAWVQAVLRELGYRELRFVPAAETIGGRSFLISHRAGENDNAPPMQIVSFRQGLDERTGRTGGGEQRSPHALMQGYLNATDHLWGMVTNGLVFRLLRENRQIDRTLRVEFDLDAMLESESFAEFQLFWLVLHRSRFVLPGERRETAWLERWSQAAASEGTRALSALRTGVEHAIEAFGQGLLAHPDNQHLRDQLSSGKLSVDDYYSELLRLVYRLLFLLVAEERHLLFQHTPHSPLPSRTGEAGPGVMGANLEERYRRYYSVSRLRDEASRHRNREHHHDDLWRSLLVTFDAMRFPEEAAALGLKPLGGGLFGTGSCRHVADDAAPGTPATGDKTAGRPTMSNAALLDAVQALSEVTRDGITRRINYRDLDVEELGSVYEGLLEHRPSLLPQANGDYRFGFGESTSRKETGSYYTPRSLVQALLDSALDPVIDAALANAATPASKERALLDLNICDPACGSGHFLLGAARRVGRRLAELRAGVDREPELGDRRRATAEVIRHCVYGVDKNPLAIDLCKVALWIESHEPGAPIGFLDHHIKRGDSLIGVFDLQVLKTGIPDGAFTPVTGDDKAIASALKKRNREERGGQLGLLEHGREDDIVMRLRDRYREIEAMPEHTAEEVQQIATAYQRLQSDDMLQYVRAGCNMWTWTFFAPMTRHGAVPSDQLPTTGTIRRVVNRSEFSYGALYGPIAARIEVDALRIGFFHWPIEFPDVFSRGGFDVVLANPPWEQVQPEEKKFFATRAPNIAAAAGVTRKRMIDELEDSDPQLASQWTAFVQLIERTGKFFRGSERYPLTARGKLNLYSLFAEHFRKVIAASGRAGIIVQSGIATDDSNKFFFADIVDKASLAAIYDFENRRALFENVHRSYKFSLLTLAGSARQDTRFRAGFFLLDPSELDDPDRTFFLGADDIALLNPNTRTCPIFRTARDAELTKAIYGAAPVLIDETKGDAGNPWGVTFRQGLFNMTSDSHLFRTRAELENDGAVLGSDGRFRKTTAEWLPLYEAKLIHQYDHRFATYERDGSIRDITEAEHADPNFVVTPRYWASLAEVDRATDATIDRWTAFRAIADTTNEYTCLFAEVPKIAAGHSLWLSKVRVSPRLAVAWLANGNTITLDFVARRKRSNPNFSLFIVKQLPVLPPETYTEDLLDLIVQRVLELTYTAWDMQPFARDLGYEGEPFVWDEERRAQLRAELDGIYAHLYGISRDDFAYILDTFPIVRDKDLKRFGEYRTKRLCLEAYDYFSPETLRALELQVREIELALRRSIVRALDSDVDRLPADQREKLKTAYESHVNDPNRDPDLRTLLESSYLTDLEKIIRSDAVWPNLTEQFESKRQLTSYVSDLNAFRNPMAHNRGVRETDRKKGEEAVAWFTEWLRLQHA